MRLAFLVATFNEQDEILDLLSSVRPYVDDIVVSDDGSTDDTVKLVADSGLANCIVLSPPTSSCEETRIRGFERITADWVLILDADERIPQIYLDQIKPSLDSMDKDGITHMYFHQSEFLNGTLTRAFAKIKLMRREFTYLPEVIHGDISVEGLHTNFGFKVEHRKTTQKQISREVEYLGAYEKKIAEGKMTREWADKVSSWHYFVKKSEDIPF